MEYFPYREMQLFLQGIDYVSKRDKSKHEQLDGNACGFGSTCNCSHSSTHGKGVVSVDECQQLEKGLFLLSKITATRVAIKKLYDQHTANLPLNSQEGIGLIFSQTWIVEIVDFDKYSLRGDKIRSLQFEENPNLTMGLKAGSATLLRIKSTVFRYFGVSYLHDYMFHSDSITFSNFSSNLSKLMRQIENPDIQPWSGFPLKHLILENSFSTLSSFIGFRMSTIKIQNVISINDIELIPHDFLRNTDLLQEISIENSYHVTLPKYFFDHLFDTQHDFNYSLTMELDIWNVQKDSIGPRAKINTLTKVNQVFINDEMRDILAANNDTSQCSTFCQRNNQTIINCSILNENEKRACGICVKNLIGDDNLIGRLNRVCYIAQVTSSTSKMIDSKTETTVEISQSAYTISKSNSKLPELSGNSTKDALSGYTTASTGTLTLFKAKTFIYQTSEFSARKIF